jgi:DNA-binding MarR family transcriptional regulator
MSRASFIDTHELRDAFVANVLDRLVNQIVEQGDELLRGAGIVFPSRTASVVLLLGERSGLSVADVAKALSVPHQLATQRIGLLIDLDIACRIDDRLDARRKVLSLTPKGREQVLRLKSSLAQARRVFAALFTEIGCDLPDAALRTIDALDRSSILARSRSGREHSVSIAPMEAPGS